MSFSPDEFRSRLLLDADVRYMNVGTSGPFPKHAYEAFCERLRKSSARGPGSPETFHAYLRAESDLRGSLSRFFGGKSEQYALTQNATEGLNIVINGMDWNPGDEIVTADIEHAGLALPVYHKASEKKLNVRIMRLLETDDALDTFNQSVSPKTRLLAISHVSYCDGRVLPMAELIDAAHRRNVPVLIDAAQSAGHLDVKWTDLDVDFVAMPGQKWLLGPEGSGALYIKEDWIERLRPDRTGWANAAGFDLNGGYSLKTTAARFEIATHDPSASACLSDSIEFLASYGMDRISARVREIGAKIRETLRTIPGVSILGPSDPDTLASGLVSFNIGEIPPPDAVKSLMKTAGIVCRSIPGPHPSAIRVSCHAFVTDDDLEALFGAVRGLASR